MNCNTQDLPCKKKILISPFLFQMPAFSCSSLPSHLFIPLCRSEALLSCSSLLLFTAAHEHDIPPHCLNGLPVLLRLCHFLLLDRRLPRCAPAPNFVSLSPLCHLISLCCLLLSSSRCHLTTNPRDR